MRKWILFLVALILVVLVYFGPSWVVYNVQEFFSPEEISDVNSQEIDVNEVEVNLEKKKMSERRTIRAYTFAKKDGERLVYSDELYSYYEQGTDYCTLYLHKSGEDIVIDSGTFDPTNDFDGCFKAPVEFSKNGNYLIYSNALYEGGEYKLYDVDNEKLVEDVQLYNPFVFSYGDYIYDCAQVSQYVYEDTIQVISLQNGAEVVLSVSGEDLYNGEVISQYKDGNPYLNTCFMNINEKYFQVEFGVSGLQKGDYPIIETYYFE